jgi:hypothetical protein
LFVLAALFEAALLTTLLLVVLLAALLAALTTGLLTFLRIASRRLMCTALLTCAAANITLFHTLIAFTIVCHDYSPLL